MNETKIDWAEMSWNPVTGCRHGCPYCYARRMAKQQYEMPAAEWRRLRPFYTLTVEALKNERDRAARRGGVKETGESSEGA